MFTLYYQETCTSTCNSPFKLELDVCGIRGVRGESHLYILQNMDHVVETADQRTKLNHVCVCLPWNKFLDLIKS